MKETCKKLLKLIFDYDNNVGGPYQFGTDGTEVEIDSLTLRNDVNYLKENGYVIEANPVLSTYRLMLTEKGERFVENNFNVTE